MDRNQPKSAPRRTKIDPATVKVSLGMTLHNNVKYLRAAVKSLQHQTHGDFGLVLVDDQSSDATETIGRRYERKDDRIRYFRNKRRLGMTETWRRAFWLARKTYPNAKYFSWISDHDIWSPTWLATMLDVLDSEDEILLVYPYTQKNHSERQDFFIHRADLFRHRRHARPTRPLAPQVCASHWRWQHGVRSISRGVP